MKLGEYSIYILVTTILIIARINKNVQASKTKTHTQQNNSDKLPPQLSGRRNGSLSGLSGQNGPPIHIILNASGPGFDYPPRLSGRRNGSLSGLSGQNGPPIHIILNASGPGFDYPPRLSGRRNGSLSGLSGQNGPPIHIILNA
ncbi:unnamed protein product, partial [Schistosoma mattheei]